MISPLSYVYPKSTGAPNACDGFWRIAARAVLLLYGGQESTGGRFMSSEIMRQIIETIQADVISRPSALEFEMAYQARVAIDRIKFAIRHADQFGKPCDAMREAGMQLLDALQRLESLDRRFQARSRVATPHKNGSSGEAKANAGKECQ
jgi:hypothetical protein